LFMKKRPAINVEFTALGLGRNNVALSAELGRCDEPEARGPLFQQRVVRRFRVRTIASPR
jgi:hypothetical protein